MFRFRLQALNQHKNDIKIAIGGYHATLMYEEIASTDDGTPSGFTRRRGKSGVGWVEERNPTFFEYHERSSLGFALPFVHSGQAQPNLHNYITYKYFLTS